MALDQALGPWGATVQGVLDLVPEASLLQPGGAPAIPADGWVSAPGKPLRGVSEAAVRGWIDQLSARVAMRLGGWQLLSADPLLPETTSDRDQLIGYARDLVHNGAASYLEGARHPERSGPATTTYDQVLWARFATGLDQLSDWLDKRLADGSPVAGDGPQHGAAGNFPPPTFVDRLPY